MAFTIKKVLISEPVDPMCGKILEDNGVEVVTKIGLSKDQLLKEIQGYDGLVVRSATKVTADVIAAGKSLTVIGRAGTGVDNIDCDAATRNGILVINSPGGNTLSAAELTCSMIITLSRHVPAACASLKSGKWDRKNFMGNELLGKTLAIIGLGRIGREVAHRLQAFGMTTVGYDPLVPAEESIKFGVETLQLEDIWKVADYITVHTPLIPQTRNLINDDVFGKCKKGIKLINCARGGIIDEDALLRALESGKCGGAGLDVYLEEPPKNTPLIQHPKVICTPHLGASTVEAQKRVAEEIALQFVDLLHSKVIPGVVNSPVLCQSLSVLARPWVAVCKTIGAVLSTLLSKKENVSLTVTVSGPVLTGMQNVLKVATTVGFLKQMGHSDVNFVNAPLLAKEVGIQVATAADSPCGDTSFCSNSVIVRVQSNSEAHSAIGTVDGTEPAITVLDDAGFENPAKLSNNAIICRGKHVENMTVKLLSSVLKLGAIYSTYWSSVSNSSSWCIINGNFSNVKQPEELKDLEFWAQIQM